MSPRYFKNRNASETSSATPLIKRPPSPGSRGAARAAVAELTPQDREAMRRNVDEARGRVALVTAVLQVLQADSNRTMPSAGGLGEPLRAVLTSALAVAGYPIADPPCPKCGGVRLSPGRGCSRVCDANLTPNAPRNTDHDEDTHG